MGTWGENSSEQLRYQTKLKNICIYKKKWLKKKGFFELTTFLERQYSDDSLYDSLGWVGVCWVSVWVFFLLLIQWYTALLRVQEKSLYSDDKMINPSCMTARYVWNEIWYFGAACQIRVPSNEKKNATTSSSVSWILLLPWKQHKSWV